MDSVFRVDYEHEKIGLLDCLHHLTLDLDVHRNPWIVGEPAGVHEPELTAVPLGAREMPVARGPGFVAYNGAVVADDAVEQSRFADVRPADKRDNGQVHAATPLGSCSRT